MKIKILWIVGLIMAGLALAHFTSLGTYNISPQKRSASGDADLDEYRRIMDETVKTLKDQSLSPEKKKEKLDSLSVQALSYDERERQKRETKEQQAISQVDEKYFQQLVNSHLSSPCIKDGTVQCLLDEVYPLIIARSFDLKKDKAFVDAVVSSGHKALAAKLLEQIPEKETPAYLQLLITAGREEDAIKLLPQFQEKYKSGGDYGATWALLRRGDLDKALQVAQLTIDWPYTDPNPPPKGTGRFTHSGMCFSNINGYPRPIEVLSNTLAEEKKFDKAYTAAQLLRHYLDKKLYRTDNNCSYKFAKWAYYNAMTVLGNALAKEGKTKEAKEIFLELQMKLPEFGVDSYNRPNYETLATAMAMSGLEKEAVDMLDQVKTETPAEKIPTFYNKPVRMEYDTLAISFGKAGAYKKAIERVESLSNTDAKINTLIKLARETAALKSKDEARKILDHLTPYLGKRMGAVYNALDYIDFADLSFDAGRIDDAKKGLENSLNIYSTLRDKDLYERIELGGPVTILYAKLGDVPALVRWVTRNDIDYNGSAGQTFSNILAYFARAEKWKEFDQFLHDHAKMFKDKGGGSFKEQPATIREPLTGILVQKKQNNRYLKAVDAIEGTGRNHLFLPGIPDDSLANAWKNELTFCYRRKEPSAEERLIGCFMDIIWEVQNREFSIDRNDPLRI